MKAVDEKVQKEMQGRGSASHSSESCSGKLPWCWKRDLHKLLLGKPMVSINHGVHKWYIWKSSTEDSILGKVAKSNRKVKFRLLRVAAILAQTHHDLRSFPKSQQLRHCLHWAAAAHWRDDTSMIS